MVVNFLVRFVISLLCLYLQQGLFFVGVLGAEGLHGGGPRCWWPAWGVPAVEGPTSGGSLVLGAMWGGSPGC